MRQQLIAAGLAAAISLSCMPTPAAADNAMGYRLMSMQEAAQLPRSGGALGMDVGPGTHITDGGMGFELLRVNGVHRGSPGAQAGLTAGDQIIAVDGRVFPSISTFAAYIGSIQPGRRIIMDTIPNGGGPQQAQRLAVVVGSGGRAVQPSEPERSGGMSLGTKLAIGAGAAALFGCYELNCFSHRNPTAPAR